MTRLNISSKPFFEISDDSQTESQVQLNDMISNLQRYFTRFIGESTSRTHSIPYQLSTKGLKKNAKRDDRVFNSIELRVLSFLEFNPSNFSLLLIKGRKTMLSDTNAFTIKCILPRYKDIGITRNTLTAFFMRLQGERILPNTDFIRRAHARIMKYRIEIFMDKALDHSEDSLDVSINRRRKRRNSISLKAFRRMLQLNLRVTNSYFTYRITLRDLNKIFINDIFTEYALHSSNSYPQKDMSKENQKRSMFKERLLSGTVLESYHYLLYFYLLHNSECVQLKRDLIKQGVLSF